MSSITKLTVLAATLVAAANISAVPIYLNPPGPVNPPNSNPTTELNMLNDAIDDYNTATPATLPDAVAFDPTPYLIGGGTVNGNGQVAPNVNGVTSVTLDYTNEQYEYAIFKWGQSYTMYYTGNETGVFTISNTQVLNPRGNPLGLSHYVLYDPATNTPDGGSSVLLLGTALAGLAGLSRFRKQ
jgi:hypothetical protein